MRQSGKSAAVRGAGPVLFAVAAGARIGFGHLVRCRSLARALRVAPVVVVRGTATTRARARAAGWHVLERPVDQHQALAGARLLVVDDPSPPSMRAWVARARRLGVRVASVHDLGIAAVASDVLIDASLSPDRSVRGRRATLHGPSFAILDPAVERTRARQAARSVMSSWRARRPRVLVALGGGRQLALAARIADAVASHVPHVDVAVAGGFAAGARRPRLARGRWIDVRDGLAREIAAATVVVTAGGVTLYEACALGVAAVAIPLNAAQHVTIRAVAGRGAAIDAAARLTSPSAAIRPLDAVGPAADAVAALLANDATRGRVAGKGQELVDGLGAFRVADQLRSLMESGT